jgi:DNA-binding MarR family transcriptional regulator
MHASEIAFTFLKRGLQNGLCLSRFATLAYLAANGERDRLEILSALGMSQSSRNSGSVVEKLVTLGLLSRRFADHGKYVYSVTTEGLRVLGLKSSK